MNNEIPDYIEYGTRARDSITHYFSIKSIRDMMKKNPVRKPHCHVQLYQINWITEGDYELLVNHKKFRVRKNNLLLIKPNTVHANQFTKSLEGYVIHFSQDFLKSYVSLNNHLSQIISGDFSNRFLVLKTAAEDSILVNDLFDKLSKTYNEGAFLKNEMLSAYLNLILLKICETLLVERTNTSHNTSLAIYHRFIEAIEQQYRSQQSVAAYAATLHISPGYLNSIVKVESGKTAGDLIRDRIIDEAKRQLICTEKNISEISYGLNFKDVSYFCRLFKKRTGSTPKLFRKEYQL